MRRQTIIFIVLGAVLIAAIVLLGLRLIETSNERDKALTAAANQATTNKAAANDACDQVEELKKVCVVDTKKLKSGPQIIAKQGIQGIQGVPGLQGLRGDQGPQGIQGEQGPPGPTGLQGKIGIPGQQGLPGLNGKDGVDGKNGKDGVDGKDGESIPGKDAPKITSVDCSGLAGSFKFTFDDGSTQSATCTP